VVDVIVLGRIEDLAPVPRSGAGAKDRILVTGTLGGSALGKHLSFTPRVKEGVFLNRGFKPTAMIDISDGLALDLCRLLDASGKGAMLEGDRIPISKEAHRIASIEGGRPLDRALSDGEDFELLFTLPPERAKKLLEHPDRSFEVTEIGEIVEDPEKRHLRVCESIEPLERKGYDHRI
jgi:thiamine-monophosphate kinase